MARFYVQGLGIYVAQVLPSERSCSAKTDLDLFFPDRTTGETAVTVSQLLPEVFSSGPGQNDGYPSPSCVTGLMPCPIVPVAYLRFILLVIDYVSVSMRGY